MHVKDQLNAICIAFVLCWLFFNFRLSQKLRSNKEETSACKLIPKAGESQVYTMRVA